MLKNAKKSIYCITSEQYLDLIEREAKPKMEIELLIISDGTIDQDKLSGLSARGRRRIHTIKRNDLFRTIVDQRAENLPKGSPAAEVPFDMRDDGNMFFLIVDDTEMLFIPPIPEMSSNAITMKNKSLVSRFKQMIAKQFDEVETRSAGWRG